MARAVPPGPIRSSEHSAVDRAHWDERQREHECRLGQRLAGGRGADYDAAEPTGRFFLCDSNQRHALGMGREPFWPIGNRHHDLQRTPALVGSDRIGSKWKRARPTAGDSNAMARCGPGAQTTSGQLGIGNTTATSGADACGDGVSVGGNSRGRILQSRAARGRNHLGVGHEQQWAVGIWEPTANRSVPTMIGTNSDWAASARVLGTALA